MKSKKAKMFLETWQTKLRGVPVNSHDDAMKAVEMAEEEMKQKAIESYLENCEYQSDWCCAGADVCIGRDCPTVKQFIEKLNS